MNTERPPVSGPQPLRALRTPSLAEETRAILRAYHVHPKQQLGQNFLIDREALESIVSAAGLKAGMQVLEIGPGIGTLTLALAGTGATVHALELDASMARISVERTALLSNVTIHQGNVLHTDLSEILDTRRSFTVVANIPYYITAPILRLFLEGRHRPASLLLMVQREVGERLAATPGQMSALSVFAQVLARVEIIRRVPATSFLPAPEVDSALIRLRRHEILPVPQEEQPYLFRVVKAGFSARRKMIHNALDSALPNASMVIDGALASVGIERTRRAETLSIAEWRALSTALRADTQHLPRKAGR